MQRLLAPRVTGIELNRLVTKFLREKKTNNLNHFLVHMSLTLHSTVASGLGTGTFSNYGRFLNFLFSISSLFPAPYHHSPSKSALLHSIVMF